MVVKLVDDSLPLVQVVFSTFVTLSGVGVLTLRLALVNKGNLSSANLAFVSITVDDLPFLPSGASHSSFVSGDCTARVEVSSDKVRESRTRQVLVDRIVSLVNVRPSCGEVGNDNLTFSHPVREVFSVQKHLESSSRRGFVAV